MYNCRIRVIVYSYDKLVIKN